MPNLVESKLVKPMPMGGAMPGDGNYRCRLYQKGAQKIVGFEFGASVTMDMTENLVRLGSSSEEEDHHRREIGFKCVDSQFFSVFDGDWRVTPTTDPENPNLPATKVEYVVDVRPRGPVPVAALEWRIREDVPANLRAVKQAAMDVGKKGVEELNEQRRGEKMLPPSSSIRQEQFEQRQQQMQPINSFSSSNNVVTSNSRRARGSEERQVATASSARRTTVKPKAKLAPVRVEWYEDETMAAYLKRQS